MIEADSYLEDGTRCMLEISELSTSFHNQYKLLTHGTSGLLVSGRCALDPSDGSLSLSGSYPSGSFGPSGEAVIGLNDLKALAKREGLQDKLPTFMGLEPFEERKNLFPTLEAAVPSEEEDIISQIVLGNLFIKQFGDKLKVSVGK